jgi:hypothetical protein
LKSLSQLPKQIVNLSEKNLVENKNYALENFEEIFPNYDTSFIKRTHFILNSEDNYNKFMESNSRFEFSKSYLTEMEDILWHYLEKNPEPSIGEVIDIL